LDQALSASRAKSNFLSAMSHEMRTPISDVVGSDEPDEAADFTGKKLLLAEDVEINAEILIALLHGTGLIIDVAKNGREAVAKVTANPDLNCQF